MNQYLPSCCSLAAHWSNFWYHRTLPVTRSFVVWHVSLLGLMTNWRQCLARELTYSPLRRLASSRNVCSWKCLLPSLAITRRKWTTNSKVGVLWTTSINISVSTKVKGRYRHVQGRLYIMFVRVQIIPWRPVQENSQSKTYDLILLFYIINIYIYTPAVWKYKSVIYISRVITTSI